MMLRFIAFAIFVFNLPAYAQDYESEFVSAWKASELNEKYMGSITKQQCMAKTIKFLKGCQTDNCMRTMAGVTGDCLTFSSGEMDDVCKDFDYEYYDRNCVFGTFSFQACALLGQIKKVACDKGA